MNCEFDKFLRAALEKSAYTDLYLHIPSMPARLPDGAGSLEKGQRSLIHLLYPSDRFGRRTSEPSCLGPNRAFLVSRFGDTTH